MERMWRFAAGRRIDAKRGRSIPSVVIYRFEDCELDLDLFELRRGDEVQQVEPQVFDLLTYLLRHRDRVVPKREILEAIWDDRVVSESALTSRIKTLRRAVGDDGRAQRILRTIHGRGYRIVAEVEEIAAAPTGRDVPSGAAPEVSSDDFGHRRSRRFEVQTRYAFNGRFSTAYQIVGDGDVPVIFIPGFVSNIELQWDIPGFADFFEGLASFCRLLVFDKRGTGLSDRIPLDDHPTVEERVDEVITLMDAAEWEQASIFGISEGGPMATLFAATYPNRVSKLILLNAWARLDWIGSEELDRRVDWMTKRWGKGKMFGEFLAPSWASNPTMRRLCARYERHAATPGTAEQILRLNAQIDVTDILPSIKQPTLVLHRRHDPFIPLSAGKLLAERIPGAKLVVLDGADHLAFAGNTETLLRHVEAFVTGPHPVFERDQRVLATVGFACMESGTEGAAGLGDRRYGDVIDRYHAEARHVGRSYQGEVIKVEGPTVLTTFAGPAKAVRAACDLQTAVEALGMKLRVGLHTAEIDATEGELTGLGVEIAAEVAKLARPGEVWASRTVRDLVAGSKLCFIERGQHQLGALGEAWALYAVER